MSDTAIIYAERTAHGGWRVAGTRVSLASVVHAYREGLSPEAIAEKYSSLSTEQVYGAIAFYLHHRKEIDAYLDQQDARWRQAKLVSDAEHGPLLDRIRKSRLAS
jgi:uncharacterized protein (DUF433 family)